MPPQKGMIQRIAERNSGKRNARFAVLFAMREEILKTMSHGWSLSQVWDLLVSEGSFSGSYDSFQRVWKRVAECKPPEMTAGIVAGEGPKPAGRTYSFDEIGQNRKKQVVDKNHEPVSAGEPQARRIPKDISFDEIQNYSNESK